jgi:peptidoglycan/LPS O-acetylase OafA/YrhL
MAIVLWHSQTGYFFKWNAFAPFYLAGAVPLFFVLSGFVLTLGSGRHRSWADFFVARFARIWPAHVAALLFLMAIFSPGSFALLSQPDMTRRLIMNILLIQDWSPHEATFWSFNAPSWSLSCEAFFYAAFPAALMLLGHQTWVRLAAIFAAIFGFVVMTQQLVPQINTGWLGSMNPIVGLSAFASGIAAGIGFGRWGESSESLTVGTVVQMSAVAAALGANAIFNTFQIRALPAGAVGLIAGFGPTPFYAALLVALARYDGLVSRVLSTPIVVYGGEISFSIYLFHQILIRWHSVHLKMFAGIPIWGQYAGFLASTFALASVVHHLIEEPSRRGIISLWRGIRAASARREA